MSIVPSVNHVQVRAEDVHDAGYVLCTVGFSENIAIQSDIEFACIFRNDYNFFHLNSRTLEVSNTERLRNGTYSFEIAIKINGTTDLIYGSVIVEIISSSNSKPFLSAIYLM